jgi:hypothetical protein
VRNGWQRARLETEGAASRYGCPRHRIQHLTV